MRAFAHVVKWDVNLVSQKGKVGSLDAQTDGGVKAVRLTLGILEALADSNRPRGVTELAQMLDVNKSRVFRHLQTLLAAGYVVKNEQTERYRSGPALRRLSNALSDVDKLIDVGRPFMQDLADRWGHTIILSLVTSDGMRVISTVVGQRPIEVNVKSGFQLPVHASAQGKILLAFGGEEYWNRLTSEPLMPLTPMTICDPQTLRVEIDRIHKRGWASSPNETMLGTTAVAAPIFRFEDELIGTIAILEPLQELGDPEPEKVAAIMAVAQRISTMLDA